MKFIYCLLAIITITGTLRTVNSVNLKNKLSTSTDTSIMEFLSSLYQNASQGPAPAQAAPANPNSKVVVNHKAVSPINELVHDEHDLGIVKEGWLRVSSQSLRDENLFPRVIQPDFKPDYIDLGDDSNFRINNIFDPSKKDDKNFPPTEYSFWFRLSSTNFWYSGKKDELEALGAMPSKVIVNAEENVAGNRKAYGAYCFYIRDAVKFNWELCTESLQERMEWICKIKELKKIPDTRCTPEEIKKEAELAKIPVTEFERKVSQPIILIPQPNRFCNDDWNYEARGADWECDCAEGLEQSPIDIITKDVIESPVVPVFTYTEVEVKGTENTSDGQVKTHTYVKMLNENHQLQIQAASFGKVVTLDGTTYNADRVVFHTPSEHRIDGKPYPMEMQIIHTGVTVGALSKHLVLSFLFVKTPGIYNKFLDDVDFFNLPNMIAKEKKMENDLYIPKILYTSDNDDIPVMRPFSLYTYQGSLTAPPCTQNTIHYVAADPIEIGSTAIELFQEAIRMPDLRSSKGDVIISTDTNENARKTMPLNGRNVYYNKIPKDEIIIKKPPVSVKPSGHYEKVVKKINNYYYINNQNPSGMPGSLIVSENEAKGLA